MLADPLSALLVVVVGGWLRPRWPIPLIGMLAATGAVAVFPLPQHGIVVLGQAATGIPTPGVPAVSAAALAALALPALVAVVVYAALRLIDLPASGRIARFRRDELVLALTTTASVLVFGVLYGVLAAVELSTVELLRRLARPHDGILGYVPGVAGMHDINDYPGARQVPGPVVYRYDAPLCFANAEDFRRRALAATQSP